MKLIGALGSVAFAASLLAEIAIAQPIRAAYDEGWPGGDALMVCPKVRSYIPILRFFSRHQIRLEIRGGLISVRYLKLNIELLFGENKLTPLGFVAKFDPRTNFVRRGHSLIGENAVLTIIADFKAAQATISAFSFHTLRKRDQKPVTIDCEVEYGPDFEAEKAKESLTDALWRRVRAVAESASPPVAVLAPETALLARVSEDVRDAAEAARDKAAGEARIALGTLPYFAESAAGRNYARSPNGRSIALGYPAAQCPAIGMAKEALSFSALSAAYKACIAALPEAPPEEGCDCAAVIVGNVLLQDASEFAYEPRPKAVLATAAEDGSGLNVTRGYVSGDPAESKGMRIDDENGREICSGLRERSAESFELRCVRLGGRFAATSELVGRRGLRGFGAALGIDEQRAEAHPRRTLVVFFHFEDAALDRITAELPEIWRE